MSLPPWLWVALTLFAAAAQTVRNTAQRQLVGEVGTLGASLVRFLYGLPFIALWLAVELWRSGAPAQPLPGLLGGPFGAWVVVAAVSQMTGTALLLRAMAARSFAVGLVYSKSEVIQVALFSAVFLGEPLTLRIAAAIAVATAGVVLLSPRAGLAGLPAATRNPAALFGLSAGAAFAISIVSYRAASLSAGFASPFLGAAETLFWSQLLQTILLGGWLAARSPSVFIGIVRAWRVSLFAGLAGATASAAGVSALSIHAASQVRTLALIEVLFTYVVSLRVLREPVSRREAAGIALVVAGVALITSAMR